MLIFDRRGGGDGVSDVWYEDVAGEGGVSECEAQELTKSAWVLATMINQQEKLSIDFVKAAERRLSQFKPEPG